MYQQVMSMKNDGRQDAALLQLAKNFMGLQPLPHTDGVSLTLQDFFTSYIAGS